MTNPDRISVLDAELLDLEDRSALHSHVASILVFAGAAPAIDELTGHVVGRLELVPRYRQKLARVPYGQGRAIWIDDPHFNPGYHVRHAALPRPGDDRALAVLAGRLFSQRLDRTKPLWELWLVEGLEGDRFALIGKTHHVLVDGVEDLDLTTVLFDGQPDESLAPTRSTGWVARPAPSAAEMLAGALAERASDPAEAARGIKELLRRPRALADGLRQRASGLGPLARLAGDSPPRTPLGVEIGPHRRYAWVDADLERFRLIKTALGGTVNDVVLAAIAGALGRYLRAQGHETDGLRLRALLPVTQPAARPGTAGEVETICALLPVGVVDPRERFAEISQAMDGLKESGRAVDAHVLTQLAGFAPSTIISQAARLQAHSRMANLTVTNVPGPQTPLFLLGRRLEAIYPVVPLADRQALGISVMSYCGRLGFGLLADYDAVPDVDQIAAELAAAIDELAALAGSARPTARPRRADGRPARAAARPPKAATKPAKAAARPAKAPAQPAKAAARPAKAPAQPARAAAQPAKAPAKPAKAPAKPARAAATPATPARAAAARGSGDGRRARTATAGRTRPTTH